MPAWRGRGTGSWAVRPAGTHAALFLFDGRRSPDESEEDAMLESLLRFLTARAAFRRRLAGFTLAPA